ncbi:hypothetical protein BN1723_020719, partial [Verticillium longisporum]
QRHAPRQLWHGPLHRLPGPRRLRAPRHIQHSLLHPAHQPAHHRAHPRARPHLPPLEPGRRLPVVRVCQPYPHPLRPAQGP